MIQKRGALGFSDNGWATITVTSTVQLLTGGSDSPLDVRVQLGAVDVDLASEQRGVATKLWDAWLGYVVKSKIKEELEGRITDVVTRWLAPVSSDWTRTPAGSEPTPSNSDGNHHSAVRAAFLKSVVANNSDQATNSSGPFGHLPFLKTGKELLYSLENPFSGPNSAVGVDPGDEEEMTGPGAQRRKSRSLSMAASLTDLATQDSTVPESIEVS